MIEKYDGYDRSKLSVINKLYNFYTVEKEITTHPQQFAFLQNDFSCFDIWFMLMYL